MELDDKKTNDYIYKIVANTLDRINDILESKRSGLGEIFTEDEALNFACIETDNAIASCFIGAMADSLKEYYGPDLVQEWMKLFVKRVNELIENHNLYLELKNGKRTNVPA